MPMDVDLKGTHMPVDGDCPQAADLCVYEHTSTNHMCGIAYALVSSLLLVMLRLRPCAALRTK